MEATAGSFIRGVRTVKFIDDYWSGYCVYNIVSVIRKCGSTEHA